MKSASLITLLLLLCMLFACRKNSKDPVVPDNRPLQLLKMTLRYEINAQIIKDSTVYAYDTAGHLTDIIDPQTNQLRRKLIYKGDTLIALVDYVNATTDTLKRPVKYFDGGNTILIDFTRPAHNGGIDTVQLTYKWAGNQLLETWTYVNLAALGVGNLQKSIITYNSSGNDYENTIIFSNGTSQWQSRGVAYDQNKNFFSTVSRLNYVFMGYGFPYDTRSVNNPVKGEFPSGQVVEYMWTYNKDGYPLTMQVKGKNYLALELQYNK